MRRFWIPAFEHVKKLIGLPWERRRLAGAREDEDAGETPALPGTAESATPLQSSVFASFSWI